MAPDSDKGNDKGRKVSRDEYEVDYYTKELGRPLQRKLLQRRLNELAGGGSAAPRASHGDESGSEQAAAMPREDRAG